MREYAMNVTGMSEKEIEAAHFACRVIDLVTSGSDNAPSDWHTDDTLTFGAWRRVIAQAYLEALNQ